MGRAAHLRRGREPARHRRGDPGSAAGRARCSSWTISRRTGPASSRTGSPPTIPRSASATGRARRAWVGRTSTGSGSRSRATPRSSSRWTPTGPTTKVLPRLIAPIEAGSADLVIGSRYTKGGGVEDWGLARRVISRGGSCSRRSSSAACERPHRRVQGVARRDAGGVPFDGVRAGGYVFQIEMTYRASRLGARVREVPITFRDRRVGRSKMSRRIIVEALLVVLRLRWEELRGRQPARAVPGGPVRDPHAIPPDAIRRSARCPERRADARPARHARSRGAPRRVTSAGRARATCRATR